jgi:hypothetical protein
VSLLFTEEIANGSAYDRFENPSGPWQQLGNTQAGDGRRFKGRSFIQITGRNNYGAFSRWAHARGLVPSDDHFVDHPTQLGDERWAWIGAAWYWRGKHPHDGLTFLNEASDAGNIETATRMINGGLNGLQDRTHRYQVCIELGDRLVGDTEGLDGMNQADFNKLMSGWAASDDGKKLLAEAVLDAKVTANDGTTARVRKFIANGYVFVRDLAQRP